MAINKNSQFEESANTFLNSDINYYKLVNDIIRQVREDFQRDGKCKFSI